MRALDLDCRIAPGRWLACSAITGVLGLSIAYATEPAKKSAPAPAAHAAAPAAQAAHGAAAAPGTAAAHGPTTSTEPIKSTGPTTTSPHGPTTSAASAPHISTSNPGGHPATATPGRPATGSSTTPNRGGSSTFAGHPAPAGSHEVHAANGAAIRTRADGSHSDIHDPKRGMDIHHGLNGNRRIAVERSDHSRIVAERGGRGFVQHPYMFHGHEVGQRTYVEHGVTYNNYYGRASYGGGYLDVYYPGRFYSPGYYGYAYAPWPAPVPYVWAPEPWYNPYAFYYAPYPVYAAPAFWVTDFVIAASLAAAYAIGHEAAAEGAYLQASPGASSMLAFARSVTALLVSPADAAPAPALNPDIKQMVADEVKLIVQQEGNEAQANAAKQDVDPGASSVVKLFSDSHPHVFVAGADLDLVSTTGKECAFSQGDVLRVASGPAGGAETVTATILASKGDKECPAASTAAVPVSDLQDMYNHFRKSIDDGLADMQKKQGKNGLPAIPASAAGDPVQAAVASGAPPPDAHAAAEIAEQSKAADAAEREDTASAAAAPAATPAQGTSTVISVGQSIDAVTTAMGAPSRIIDLGAKKIYTYPDMKVIFMNGKVSDVQ